MDRRTRTSWAAGLALALAGCSLGGIAISAGDIAAVDRTPPHRRRRRAPATQRCSVSDADLGPALSPGPSRTSGIVVDGPHLLFTMPASGGDGMQLVEGRCRAGSLVG